MDEITREELGLCYSVYTYQSFYRASGLSGETVGKRPATADAAVDAIVTMMDQDGYGLRDLVIGVVTSEPFARRAAVDFRGHACISKDL